MNLFPPILESQRASIQAGPLPDPFRIPFTMPLATTLADIGHIQVLVRRQANMEYWSNQDRIYKEVPDRDVMYLTRDRISGLHATNPLLDTPRQDYYVDIPARFFRGNFQAGVESDGETYSIQIRFGVSKMIPDAISGDPGFTSAADFAAWRNFQTTNSRFGEWSNSQRMFVHAGYTLTVSNNPSPIAGLNWSYVPNSNDPLSQVRIQYSWSTPDDDAYGNMFRSYNLDFQSHDGTGASAAGVVDMGVMRFSKLTVVLTLTTINNTVITTSPNPFIIERGVGTGSTVVDFGPGNVGGYINRKDILGEEIDDGVLAINFGWPQVISAVNRNYYHNVYRVNLRTLETILTTQIPAQGNHPATKFDTILKDYSVEMGEEYIYFIAAFDLAHQYKYALVWDGNLTPSNWKPHLYPGYARQMDFQGNTFLTTKWGQLKLQGNVQVNNFQRNTSDQFTTTIGGEFPFYSRSAQFNYRTLSLQGLVSMNFDPTNTFLRFRSQLASTGMTQAVAGVVSRYSDAIVAINNADVSQIEKNIRRDAALGQYYREMEMIYRGISPTTGLPFSDLPDRPLWMTGQLWLRHDQDNEQLVLRDTELFSDYQYSNSVKRVRDPMNPDSEKFERSDTYNQGDKRGPTTIFSTEPNPAYPPLLPQKISKKVRDATHIRHSDRASDIIYAERKFREAVMEWLSDGKPKLFRSETEGNMIVMLTGVSFTPFNKSRQTYSLSCTVTEIAKYNLTNLVSYGLIPVKFEAYPLPIGELGIVYGDRDLSVET